MNTIESAGILINSNNLYLLVHPTGAPTDQGWGIPKGIVDAGESFKAAAIRETREECGLDISENEIELLTKVKYRSMDENKKDVWKELTIFIHVSSSDLTGHSLFCSSFFNPEPNNPNIKLPEINMFKWVTLTDGKRMVFKSLKPIFDLL